MSQVCSPDDPSIDPLLRSPALDSPWGDAYANAASVEFVVNDEDNCAVDAEAALMSVRDDDMFCAALEANQQDAKFAMAMGTTYHDEDDKWLFKSLADPIVEGEAVINAYRAGNPRGISSESLSKLWGISEKNEAARTLN